MKPPINKSKREQNNQHERTSECCEVMRRAALTTFWSMKHMSHSSTHIPAFWRRAFGLEVSASGNQRAFRSDITCLRARRDRCCRSVGSQRGPL